ncbi:MAG: dihydrolipoamide acetyltransferase family protein [Phycisphaerales bacterium]
MAGNTSTDPNVFILPDLGEGVHEAELISWKVQPGETVEEHQTVAEMETDKALVEVPSPRAGVIGRLCGEPGDILKVGEPAWTYEGGGESANGAAAPTQQPSRTEEAETAEEEREDAGTVVGSLSEMPGVSGGGKVLATPAVRRLARDLGVDINGVKGTGLAGRVTDRDVRAASGGGGGAPAAHAQPAPEPKPEPAPQPQPAARRSPSADLATTVPSQEVVSSHTRLVPQGDTQIVPVRGLRRTIGQRLRESVDRAVHFSVMDEADVSELDNVRKRLAAASGEKISYLPFVASAVCRALKEFPMLNAHVDDEQEQILRYAYVHMGIATDTEQGLSVPVIPNADALGVLEIGRHVSELARMARDRSIPRERLSGSTFTISNVGSYAGRFATPIINYPEVGILAVGRVHEGVVADRGAIRIAKLIPLSLTCDHRSVDGADAARCLALIIDLLKRPEELLTPAR